MMAAAASFLPLSWTVKQPALYGLNEQLEQVKMATMLSYQLALHQSSSAELEALLQAIEHAVSIAE